MPALARLRAVWRTLFQRAAAERELDDELRAYVELLVAEKVRAGMDPAAARRAALIETGGVDQVKEAVRDARPGRRLESLLQDLRYALRGLRREPVFAAAVVLTLALPVGTNAATFGLVRQLMLAPPPGVREPERVARVRLRYAEDGDAWTATTASYPAFAALRATRAFAAAAATRPETLTVGRGAELARVAALAASGDYFATLGARPALGRFFGAPEDDPAGGTPVVVLGHAYWRRAFGGERGAVGSEIVLDGRPFTVIGVAPPRFDGDQTGAVDVYLPLSTALAAGGAGWADDADRNVASVVVRLREGVSPEAAARAATAAIRESSARRTLEATVELAPVVPGSEARETPQARVALWLAGVSLVILLVATASAGTLFSLRWARRRREIAMRIALGAGRGHLATQLLAEGLLLAALGAAVGLLLCGWLSDAVRATLLPHLAAADAFVDRRVLAASVLAALAAGAAAGLSPLARADRGNLALQLRAGGLGVSDRTGLRSALVGAQVALGTLLLVGAALFVRSLHRVRAQDLGFTTERLLHVTLDFRGWVPGPERDLAYREAERRVRALPEVAGATVVQGIPFGPHHIPPVAVPGRDEPPNVGGQVPIMYGATSEYLDLMGVAVVRGRLITERDGPRAPLVVLVNETMARRVWPGRSGLGECVRVGFGVFPPVGDGNPAAGAPCREVVGVVRDSRARSLLPDGGEDGLMQYYVPFGQLPSMPRPDASEIMGLMVRARGDVDRAAARVQRAIHATSAVPVYAHARRYQDFIDPQLRTWRLGATLFTAFGALALGIAAAGVFGVVSYAAAQRTREMGIRLALGATRRAVARLVVADALRVSAAGTAVGIAAALVAGPLMEPLLFRTSARDPGSLAAAALALLLAALAAAAWPAWRAGRVDPATALRADG